MQGRQIYIPSDDFVFTRRGVAKVSELKTQDEVLGTAQNRWVWTKFLAGDSKNESGYLLITDAGGLHCLGASDFDTPNGLTEVRNMEGQFDKYSTEYMRVLKPSDLPWNEILLSRGAASPSLDDPALDENLMRLLGYLCRRIPYNGAIVACVNQEYSETLCHNFRYYLEQWGERDYDLKLVTHEAGYNYPFHMVVRSKRLSACLESISSLGRVPIYARQDSKYFMSFCEALEQLVVRLDEEAKLRYLRFFADELDLISVISMYYSLLKKPYEVRPVPLYYPFRVDVTAVREDRSYPRVMSLNRVDAVESRSFQTLDPTWFPIVNMIYMR